MTTQFEIDCALMAGRVYQSSRPNATTWLSVPNGWEEFAHAPTPNYLTTWGFEVGAFSKGSNIVISYAGTRSGLDLEAGADWAANINLGILGATSEQLFQAAKYYIDVKAANPTANITFTGHSLGGGLASLMGVFFNRTAVTFDQAPFRNAASWFNASDLKNRLLAIYPSTTYPLVASWLEPLSKFVASFDPLGLGWSSDGLKERENANVTSINAKGEFLSLLPDAIRIGTSTSILHGTPDLSLQFDLHSQALLSAFLVSENFRTVTYLMPDLIRRIFDGKLYKFNNKDSDVNFIDHLVRYETGTAPGAKSSNMLTHFANDFQKLGTNVAGLNQAAQNALIAQGIEWYYWQRNDYAQQEFFTRTGELIQYTSNQGDITSLKPSANKALQYTTAWLSPMLKADGGDSITVSYAQWNVVTGIVGTTATAKDSAKSQMFVGGEGADTFTGGSKDDMLLGGLGKDTLSGGGGADYLYGGADDDTLDGGAGADRLYGGAGNDTYKLKNDELFDIISDSDGNGIITVGGVTLTGGKKVSNNYWTSDDKKWDYLLMSGGDLVIVSTVFRSDKITVSNWQASGGNRLGIVLDDAPAPPTPPMTVRTYSGDQRALLDDEGKYDWESTSWTSGGNLINGVSQANFADVIKGSGGNDKIDGLGGNDALAGGSGNDEMNGGDGDDLIGGGAGSDRILGGAGNDFISSASNLPVNQRVSPGESWSPPAGKRVLGRGPGWAVYEDTIDGSLIQVWTADAPVGTDGDYADGGAGDDDAPLTYPACNRSRTCGAFRQPPKQRFCGRGATKRVAAPARLTRVSSSIGIRNH